MQNQEFRMEAEAKRADCLIPSKFLILHSVFS